MKINLASTKLALVLIALTLVFLILSALIPQKEIAVGQLTDLRETLGAGYQIIEALRLDRIYTTPYFYATLGLLAINLFFGTLVRFKTVLRVERTLLKARHLGSILFHLSLLIVITSIIANYLFKYDGVLALTEGQRIRDSHEAYFREFQGPLEPGIYDRFGLRLDEVNLNYPVQDASATAARITVWPANSGITDTGFVHTNRPLVVGDMEIHYGMTYGYSPELLILDSMNSTLFKGFIRLATRTEGEDKLFNDFYVEQISGLHIDMTVIEDSGDGLKTLISVELAGEPLASETISTGDTISVQDWKICLPRMRRWCYLNVIENPWLDWVFTGFWLALVGMTVSFIPRIATTRKASK